MSINSEIFEILYGSQERETICKDMNVSRQNLHETDSLSNCELVIRVSQIFQA